MVGMEYQDEMVEMESQEAKGRGETLVCRDHLARKVCMHFNTYVSPNQGMCNFEIALHILGIPRLHNVCAISRSHAPVHPTESDLLRSSQDGRHP